MLNQPCIPGMTPTWLWCFILAGCCAFWFTSTLWRICVTMPWGWLACCFFSCNIFVWFWSGIGVTPALQKELGSFTSPELSGWVSVGVGSIWWTLTGSGDHTFCAPYRAPCTGRSGLQPGDPLQAPAGHMEGSLACLPSLWGHCFLLLIGCCLKTIPSSVFPVI